MRAALIPPIPDLDRYATGPGIHLLLSHLFKKKGYLDYYAGRSAEGDYLILDNSAHEHGVGNSMETLLKEAKKVSASEVVVPDALFHAKSTVEAARCSLRYLEEPKGQKAYDGAMRPRLMYVPQGNSRPEWAWCLKSLLALHEGACLGELAQPVIGISKDYYWWQGGINILLKTYVQPLRKKKVWEGLDVHLLGWPTDLWQTALVAREYPWVRSTDSAKPFVYAKNKILLEPGGDIPDYPRRDKRYFDDRMPDDLDEIVHRNIEVFNAAATDNLILTKVS